MGADGEAEKDDLQRGGGDSRRSREKRPHPQVFTAALVGLFFKPSRLCRVSTVSSVDGVGVGGQGAGRGIFAWPCLLAE